MDYNAIIKEFSKIYPSLENINVVIVKNNKEFVGKCTSESYGDYVYIGKMRYKNSVTSCISLTETASDMTFVFFHEMTHAITPYYERKVKSQWVRMDHSDKFYKNFMDIMKIAYEKKYIGREYSLQELKKRDGYMENIKSDRNRFSSQRIKK